MRPRGGVIGMSLAPSQSAASGLWSLREAEAYSRDSMWPALAGPPTNVAGTAGDAQITLAWTAPSATGGSAITGYNVEYTPSGGTATSVGTGSTAASYTVTSLANGTAYSFRIAAVTSNGVGAYSAASGNVTPTAIVFRAIPAMTSNTTPSGVVTGAGNRGSNTDDELWKAFDGSSSSGSVAYFAYGSSNAPKRSLQYAFPDGQKSRIAGYSISLDSPDNSSTIPRQWGFYGSDDLSTWTLIENRDEQASGSSTPNNWFQTSITAGEARTFILPAAVNYRAYRWVFEESFTSSGRTLAIREVSLVNPAAPTSVTATGGNAQATVSWTAPSVITQAPITGYVVEWTPSGGSPSTVSTGSTSTSYTKTGLTNGTAYTFRVAAVNSVGTGAYSTASSAVTPAAAAGITVLSGSASGSGTNTITATATGNISVSVPSTRTLSWTGSPGQYIVGPQQAGFSYDSEIPGWYRNFIGSSFSVIAGTYTTENTGNGATLTFTP